MNRFTFFAGMLIAGAGFSAAIAKTAEQATDGITPMTEQFITKANIGNQFEIDSSKLALDRSEDATVRAFAKSMIEDHTNAKKNMRAVLPTDTPAGLGAQLDEAHEAKLEALRNTSEEGFDAAYVKIQQQAHDETVALFNQYAAKGDEADLKEFAAITLPTLKAHQAHIKSVKKSGDEYVANEMKATPSHHTLSDATPMAVQRN